MTVRFLQVHITNDGHTFGSDKWWMIASVMQAGYFDGVTQHAPRADPPLFDQRTVSTGETISLPPAARADISIAVDEGLRSAVRAGDQDGHYHETGWIRVSAMTWGGTRTIECKDNGGGYKVTFELLWGALV